MNDLIVFYYNRVIMKEFLGNFYACVGTMYVSSKLHT